MPDEFTIMVTVNVEDDDIMETDEMFFGRLREMAGDTIAKVIQSTATITIVDNDGKYAQELMELAEFGQSYCFK